MTKQYEETGRTTEYDWFEKYKSIGQVHGLGITEQSCGKLQEEELATNWDAIDVQLRHAKARINQLFS